MLWQLVASDPDASLDATMTRFPLLVLLSFVVSSLAGCRRLSTATAPQNPAVKQKNETDVETHYERVLKLDLSASEKEDLIQFLRSL